MKEESYQQEQTVTSVAPDLGEKLADVMSRACSSALYQRQWKDAGVRPEAIQKAEELNSVPFTTPSKLVGAYQDKGIDKVLCSQVETWFHTRSSNGIGLWLPLSMQDILQALHELARLSHVVGLADNDIILALTHAAPSPSDAVPVLFTYAHRLKTGLNIEVIPLASEVMDRVMDWMSFCVKRRPTVLFATPGDVLRLIESKFLLEGLRLGLFYGEPLAPSRKEIIDAYKLAPHQIYGLEFFLFNVECQAHDGIHMWLDSCISEIIPEVELDKEKNSPSYIPSARLLSEAEPGLTGEHVVTTFGEALPLIRYRTGNLIEVVSTERCTCGQIDPRIKLL